MYLDIYIYENIMKLRQSIIKIRQHIQKNSKMFQNIIKVGLPGKCPVSRTTLPCFFGGILPHTALLLLEAPRTALCYRIAASFQLRSAASLYCVPKVYYCLPRISMSAKRRTACLAVQITAYRNAAVQYRGSPSEIC